MVPQSLSRHLPALLFILAAVILAASALTAPTRASVTRSAPRAAAVEPPARGSTFVSVIVQHRGSAAEARSAVVALGGMVTRDFTIIPALQAELPANAIDALATHAAVRSVSLNVDVISTGKSSGKSSGNDPATCAPSEKKQANPRGRANREPRPCAEDSDLASVFPEAIGATQLWAEGVTGAGIGIAVLDSGLNGGTKDDFGSRLVAEVSVVRGTRDHYGHGTLVASIAAGDGAHSGQRFAGIAPGANVISVKVGDFERGATSADVIAGLEWVLAHRAQYNIRVVNLSLSEPVPTSYLTNPLNAAVERVWLSGIVVVAAQGNRGSGEYAVDHAPGNDPLVISVGAFSDNGTVDANDDYLKSWSSRGVTHDGFAKPDVIAPGSKLIGSVGQGSSFLYRDNPDNRVGGRYVTFSGTSAAAPVVSGVVALMLEREPGLTPGQIKARLLGSADTLGGSDAPRVDAYAAAYSDELANADAGVALSYWIDAVTGTLREQPVTADGIRWDGIRWDGIRWDGIKWDGIKWDGIKWDGIKWD
ncbi:MAG: S8 family peptidase [Chloroflexi bacterium]|nr:S8 family peptidase [Chloroflexota bacterium]